MVSLQCGLGRPILGIKLKTVHIGIRFRQKLLKKGSSFMDVSISGSNSGNIKNYL